MEKLFKLFTLSLFAALLIFVGCGGGDDDDDTTPETPEEISAGKLVAPWTALSSVKLDGVDIAGWENFSITITGNADGGAYSTTGAADASVWPSSGNWTFVPDSNGLKVSRSDGIEISITTSATTLSLTFDIVEGRTQGITGTWVFVISR
ncbi:MAG: hypothetical protein O2887_19115 [Bacteroidetes bacterium]|nr:hypothetical protein [Bacteroidota bacterium]MDA1122564.1 hypothetical protein [Bacteroidota bacterium]